MKNEELVRMANQISQFFEPYPEAEAIAGTAGHIKNFWDPRMKKQLFAMLDAGETDGLLPLAQKAAEQLKQQGVSQ